MTYAAQHSSVETTQNLSANKSNCEISESQRHKAYKRMIKRGSASSLYSYNGKTIYLGSVTL